MRKMNLKLIEKRVLDPIGETAKLKVKINKIGEIRKLSLLDNTKPNADIILETVASQFKDTDVTKTFKPAGAAASSEELKKALKTDLCILALGDCGSCTTWLILDAIRLEEMGIPTISICSEKFSDFACKLAKAYGANGLRIIEIDHPIAGLEKRAIIRKSLKIMKDIKKFIGASK